MSAEAGLLTTRLRACEHLLHPLKDGTESPPSHFEHWFGRRSPGHAIALRDGKKLWDYFADENCPGYAFCTISFKTWGRTVQMPCNPSAKQPTPSPPTTAPSHHLVCQNCTASCLWCSTVPHAYCCQGPPHGSHRFWLGQGVAPYLPRGSALSMRALP
jgi:hypothetical protein